MTELISPEAVTAETKLGGVLELEVCGRCGGSGHYSWNQRDGSRCYGCGGSGKRHSKRGAAALQYSRWLRTMNARLIREGDGVPVSVGIGRQVLSTVTSVEVGFSRARSIYAPEDPRVEKARAEGAQIEGYREGQLAVRHPVVRCETKRGSTEIFASEDVTCAIRPGEKVAHLKAVALYQQRLTKAGKVRKEFA